MIIYIISTIFFFLFHLIQLYFSTIDPLTMSSCNNIVYHRTVETAFFNGIEKRNLRKTRLSKLNGDTRENIFNNHFAFTQSSNDLTSFSLIN